MKYLKTLEKLTDRKKLNLQAFISGGIRFDDDLAVHAAFCFVHIYSVPQVANSTTGEIARLRHGIAHVISAAFNGTVFTNFYRRHKNPAALNLTSFDLKLIQLALLFHDACRENEDEDLWDHESGLLLYFYLTHVLKVSHETAKLMAEAVANKDPSPQGYRILVEENDELIWTYVPARPKNIYEIIIHDADCLDIIRARDHFDATYLDFYKLIVKEGPDSFNEQAFNEMAKLIIEARSFITLRGDGRTTLDVTTKKRFENKNVVVQLLSILDKKIHPMIITLYADGKLLKDDQLQKPLWESKTYDPAKGMTAENLDALLLSDHAYMLIRGIGTPSAIDKKNRENLAHLEIRKTKRRGIKNGNVDRSTTLIGYGAAVYAPAGFIILNPTISDMDVISSQNRDTGRGKKAQTTSSMSVQEKDEKVKTVRRKQKVGGDSRRDQGYVDTHNEITYRITVFDAIYYTNDQASFNYITHRKYTPYHSHAPFLQAFFLQNEYHLSTGKRLPIFEYSGVHNYMRSAPVFNSNAIVAMWQESARDYLCAQLAKGRSTQDLLEQSLDDFKTQAMYDKIANHLASKNAPADSNYSVNIKTEINTIITSLRVEVIKSYPKALLDRIKAKPVLMISNEIFFHLLHFPALRKNLKTEIETELKKILNDNTWTTGVQEDLEGYTSHNADKITKGEFEQHCYRYNTMRIYALAKLAKDQNAIELIKTKVHSVIDANMENFGEHSEGILAFSIFCDLYEQLTDKIHKEISATLTFYENPENVNNTYLFHFFINEIVNAGVVNKDISDKVQNILRIYKDALSCPNHPSRNVPNYSVRNIETISKTIGDIEQTLLAGNRISFRSAVNWLQRDLITPEDQITSLMKNIGFLSVNAKESDDCCETLTHNSLIND